MFMAVRIFLALLLALECSHAVLALRVRDSRLPLARSYQTTDGQRVLRQQEKHEMDDDEEENELYNKQRNSDTDSGQVETISYNGGKLIAGVPINVYLIFYGKWGKPRYGARIISNFVRSMSDTSVPAPSVAGWWNISTTYYMKDSQSNINFVSPKVNMAYTFDFYSQGAYVVGKKRLQNIVSHSISTGKFPADSNAVYAVLTSPDIASPGLCKDYCGYHTSMAYGDKTIYYAFVGHASRCIDSCAFQSLASPNGNPGIDGIVSTLAHEITETVTDPESSGWMSSKGEENADICAWKFEPTVSGADSLGRGYKYNMVGSGGMKFLVQLNMDNIQQACIRQAGDLAPGGTGQRRRRGGS